MSESNKDNTASICKPLTIDLTDEQFDQLDRGGLILKSETNEISVPAGDTMQALGDIMKMTEGPDEITQEIQLKDRLAQVRDINSFLYEIIGVPGGTLELSASARRGLGEIILRVDGLIEEGVDLV